jgi:hypothetical protein
MTPSWFPKILVALSVLATLPASAGTKTTSTWSAPGLQPATYAKVAVLAKIEDEIAKRTLEDEVVEGLQDRGIEAVAAYQVLTPADLASEEAIRAKAQDLGLDAGLVFTVTDEQTRVKSGSNVHASVGVPVRAGPFSVFVGTSVPLGGGTSSSTVVALQSEFYVAGADGPQWIATYSTSLKGGNKRAAEGVASQALKQLKKAKLFE